LKLRDIDFEENRITVREGKGGKPRIIPVPKYFVDEMKPYLKLNGVVHRDHYVFGRFDDPSVPVSPQRIDFMFRRLVDYAHQQDPASNIDDISLHSLRHTSATVLYVNGLPLKEVQNFLGHAKIETTALYTLLDVEGLRKMAASGFEGMRRLIEGAYHG
jgi:integrase